MERCLEKVKVFFYAKSKSPLLVKSQAVFNTNLCLLLFNAQVFQLQLISKVKTFTNSVQ